MSCTDGNIIALIKDFTQRSEFQAFKCLLKCQPQAHGALLGLVARNEEDRSSMFNLALAEFFIQVRRGKFVLTGEAKICTYVIEIAKRKWLHNSRSNSEKQIDIPEPEPSKNEELSAHIQSALQQLSATDRDILVSFYLYDQSLLDYAEKKKISHENAKKRISRARKRLKSILKPAKK